MWALIISAMQQAAGETAHRERKTSVEEYEWQNGHIGRFLLWMPAATCTHVCARHPHAISLGADMRGLPML